jgi:hypothetical protein
MPYLRLRAYGLITALLCLAGSVQAQTPPLTADRPGIGIGTGVVLPETFQIEGGFAYDRAPRFNGYSFGQVLLRYGLNPSWSYERDSSLTGSKTTRATWN